MHEPKSLELTEQKVQRAQTSKHAASSRQYVDDTSIAAARSRVEDTFRGKLTWPDCSSDCDAASTRQWPSLASACTAMAFRCWCVITLSTLAIACVDAADTAVSALVFEQVYLSRLTKIVQEKGDYWGGKTSVPSRECRCNRASGLVTASHVQSLLTDGLVVIDGALTPEEVRAAREEIAELDRGGQLRQVEYQSKARLRNDRIGWLSPQSAAAMPAIGVAMRLLRAMPAEVEVHAESFAAALAAGSSQPPLHAQQGYWRTSVPTLCMVAVYAGSLDNPTFYCRHYDGGSPGSADAVRNPRRLTVICYLNDDTWDVERDGGALRAYYPPTSARSGSHVDIAPKAGRVLMFDSCTVEHEVRPTYATRMALTLWASKG